MTTSWIPYVQGAGAIFAALAAGLWLWASLITVPDNIDTIVGALQKIGRLNACGAGAASAAAICGLVMLLREIR